MAIDKEDQLVLMAPQQVELGPVARATQAEVPVLVLVANGPSPLRIDTSGMNILRDKLPSFLGHDTIFWTGVVEARNDPLQMGRTQCRIHGYHTEDKSLIPTEALPWAIPVMPANMASNSGVGESPNGLMEGSLVLGIWLDGPSMQVPAVLGSLNTFQGQGPGGILNNRNNTISPNGTGTAANTPGTDRPTGDGPRWLQVARGELGQKEIPGQQDNPRILEYHRSVGLSTGEATPWCSSFVFWCLKQAGVSTAGGSAMAKSWLTASSMQAITSPQYGCLVVFHRPPNPQSGHVGFYVGAEGGRIKVLGGNQGDAVSIAGYSTDRLAGYRWPAGQPQGTSTGTANNSVTTTSQRQS